MTCNLASLSGAMYHGFEGAISTFGVYFPYLNLALKWSNEPGPPHKLTSTSTRPRGASLPHQMVAGWGGVFAGQISLQVCYQPVVKVSKCQPHNLE